MPLGVWHQHHDGRDQQKLCQSKSEPSRTHHQQCSGVTSCQLRCWWHSPIQAHGGSGMAMGMAAALGSLHTGGLPWTSGMKSTASCVPCTEGLRSSSQYLLVLVLHKPCSAPHRAHDCCHHTANHSDLEQHKAWHHLLPSPSPALGATPVLSSPAVTLPQRHATRSPQLLMPVTLLHRLCQAELDKALNLLDTDPALSFHPQGYKALSAGFKAQHFGASRKRTGEKIPIPWQLLSWSAPLLLLLYRVR